MLYQQRRVFYCLRPRPVYRRPQPERSFNFSPLMSELDDIYGYPVRQQANEKECSCENCKSGNQEQVQKLEPESDTETLPEPREEHQVIENHDDSESEYSESEDEKTEEKIEDSKNYKAIIEISKQSEAIQKDLENTDWDCLDEKQEMKKLRYAAENQYKLIEKLDLIHSENIEERNLRKSTVKSIQKRLDSLDSKLN